VHLNNLNAPVLNVLIYCANSNYKITLYIDEAFFREHFSFFILFLTTSGLDLEHKM